MKWLSIISLALSTNLYANHLETVCKSALQPYPGRTGYMVSNPPQFSKNFISRGFFQESERLNIVEDFNGNEIYQSENSIRSIVETEESLWLLFDYDVLNLSFKGDEIARYPFVFNPNPQTTKAVSMGLANDLLLIARGSEGLTALNTRTGKIQWHKEFSSIDAGKPIAVAFDGSHAQVVFTSTRENGFNGIATLDIDTLETLHQSQYNQRRAGVISPDAKAHWSNNNLILNNGGWIHVITRKQIQDEKPFKPKWLAVEVGGDRDLHYMMLTGDFFIENNKLIGCGKQRERNGDQVTHFARLFEVKLD